MVGTQKDEFLHVGFITSLSIIDSHRGAVCLLLNMIKMFMSGLSFLREILLSKRERKRLGNYDATNNIFQLKCLISLRNHRII